MYVNLGCGGCFHPDWVNFDFTPQHSEVIQHDLRKRLPLPDGCCAVVYSSHVLEHFSRVEAQSFVAECFRILGPGGTFRIVVPDLENIVRLYLKNLEGALAGDEQAEARHEWMTIELLDQLVREQSGGEMLKYWRQNPMPAESFVIERMGREVLQFIEASRARPQAPAESKAPSSAEVMQFRETGELHKWMYDRCSLRQLLEKKGFAKVKACTAQESRIPEFGRYGLDLNPDGSVRKPDSLFMEAEKPQSA